MSGPAPTHDHLSLLRAFNRTVTERIGALDEEYLARGRPLGASRVLWEIGPMAPTCAPCAHGWASIRAT